MQILEKKKKKVTINVTSLIDVLFLLLIFFMVSSTFKEQPGMKLELPEAQSAEIAEVKEMILQIQKGDGGTTKFTLNSETLSLEQLSEKLKALLPQATDSSLTLKADKGVTHGIVVEVMDIAKQSGIKKLVIATKIKSE